MSDWFDANPYLTLYSFGNPIRTAYHTGADLNLNSPTWDADKGQPVYAAANGLVTFAELVPAPSTWGRLVVIRHVLQDGSIVHSRYGHLASLVVEAGQVVQLGDVLGTIGGAEFGLANHLHFDISHSAVLESNPTHWPGSNKQAVLDNYTDPKAFLLAHV
jgi:murein DD-endopeptidase MepM/ murein hydrolase activator NlpD